MSDRMSLISFLYHTLEKEKGYLRVYLDNALTAFDSQDSALEYICDIFKTMIQERT